MYEKIPLTAYAKVNPPLNSRLPKPDCEVSFIPMQDVSDGGDWSHRQTKKLLSISSGYTAFQEGDILFAKITPCMENGKGTHAVGLVNGVGYGSTEFHVLRAEKEASPRFIFHLCNSRELRQAAEVQMTGSAGQKRVPTDFFSKFLVTRLNRGEQQAIAAVLDTMDEAIRQTETVIAKLRQVKAGMLHDLLTHGLEENGQLRNPIRHPDHFKDSPLGRIPRTWDIVKLGDVFSMQAGKFLSSEHIKKVDKFPVFGGNGLRGYTSTYTHEGEYVLIGRQGALCGNIVVASNRFYATEHAVIVTPIEKMNIGWIASYLTAMNLYRFSESSAQPGLSVQKLSHHKIKLPKFLEQEAIDFKIKSISKQLDSQVEELVKLRSLKQGLMHDLLTGTIRVPQHLQPYKATVADTEKV